MAQTSRVSGVATRVYQANGATLVAYHSTDVVRFDDKTVTLNTGGWFTNTTKLRMNQASNEYGLGFTVQQKDGQWFVHTRGEGTLSFNGSSITFKR